MGACSEALALLGCYMARVGSWLQTFRENIFSIFKGHAVQEDQRTSRIIAVERKAQISRRNSEISISCERRISFLKYQLCCILSFG